MIISDCNVTVSQKKECASIAMREAAKFLAEREKISYEEALLRFTSSRMYKPCLILKQRFGKKDRIIL